MVLACWQANVWTVETSKYRPLIREYLAMVEDACERARKDWEEDARANAVFNQPFDEEER
jgi:hypothetical protein